MTPDQEIRAAAIVAATSTLSGEVNTIAAIFRLARKFEIYIEGAEEDA